MSVAPLPLADWQSWLEPFLRLEIEEPLWFATLETLQAAAMPEAMLRELWQWLFDQRLALALPSIPIMDCCGTGGSGRAHFNTSTTVAFVLAAGGVAVVKFGNRAISSQSGSFDFLEGLGIPAKHPPEAYLDILNKTGLAFLFAPAVYAPLAQLQQRRKQCARQSVFNQLGPLLHPLKPTYRLMGCSAEAALPPLSRLIQKTQPWAKRALLLRSSDGMDELEADVAASGFMIEEDQASTWRYDPEEAASWLPPVDKKAQEQMGSFAFNASDNVALFHALTQGELSEGHPVRRQVCLNAAFGFWLSKRCATPEAGYELANALLRDRAVASTYRDVQRAYQH